MDLPQVIFLEQTCGACPSQWEGKLADGRGIYIRFRYGRLTLTFFEGDEYCAAPDETMQCHLVWESDDEWDGVMDTSEMMGHTNLLVNWQGINAHTLQSFWTDYSEN